MMTERHLIEEIQHVSLSMFRKNFFGVHHGSISARVNAQSFLINTKEAIFDEIREASLIRLESDHPDYRRNLASIDASIHEEVYRHIPHAKYVAYTMPPYVTAYVLSHKTFAPMDFFGDKHIGEIDVYDPGHFSDWYDRAPHEIANYFHAHAGHVMLIKGYGVYAYDRDLTEMAKKIAILENSARLMMLSS
jgi:L-fuculose-phosphate aldolase